MSTSTPFARIQLLLAAYHQALGLGSVTPALVQVRTRAVALISELTPPDHPYRIEVRRQQETAPGWSGFEAVLGILQAVREDVLNGVLPPQPALLPPPVQGPSARDRLLHILRRFHLSANQLVARHANRATLRIADEYDVQDLLHAVLRIEFDDVREEEWTPSMAGGSSRIDLLVSEIDTAIEAKMTRDTLRDRQVGDELLIDIAHYSTHTGVRTLVCFVFDPGMRLQNPAGLIRDLEGRSTERLAVRVVISPPR